jgi:lactoylglutathione lyase
MLYVTNVEDPDEYWVEIIGQKPVEATEGISETSVETYRMVCSRLASEHLLIKKNHTMIRVKDAEKSLAFYQDVMGMKLIRKIEAAAASFNLYFLGYGAENPNTADYEGLLELTYNYGTEKEPDFKYHNGNDQPQGFGHICVCVDDVKAACDRFEEKGVCANCPLCFC